MEPGDSADEVQAKAITCGVAAGFQSCESFDDSRQISSCYARSVIDDLQASPIAGAHERETDQSTRRCMALCIFDEVDGSLCQQLAVARYGDFRFDRP